MSQAIKRKKIMLIITEDCNLRCHYCYEQDKRKRAMTFPIAREVLDNSFTEMEGYDGVTLELHGGEPFLNFDLIKQIDHYILTAYPQLDFLVRTTTNGTLVHGEIQEWLYSRRDRYEVMLSLDGTESVHNMNRPAAGGGESFKMIDLAFFTRTWEDCPVYMTVTESTLPFLAESVMWIQEKGFDCLNALEWAVEWNLERSAPVLAKELRTLVKYYSDNPHRHTCLMLNCHLERFYEPIKENFRYCVDIDDPIECFDAAGVFAPCHGFTSFTMGNQEEAEAFAAYTIRDFEHADKCICKGCKLIRLCRTCFAANYMLSGDMQIQSPELCALNRMCILAGIQILRNRGQDHKMADEVEQYILSLNDGAKAGILPAPPL